MPRTRECPKCEGEMTLEDYDPSCGIEGGWVCDCGHTAPFEGEDFDD